MTAFALVLQVATLLFAAWAILTTPIILLPLTALAVVFAFYRWYFRRYGGLLARLCGIIALLAVLLLSELLMVVVWAAVTGEQVTLQLWAEDVPGSAAADRGLMRDRRVGASGRIRSQNPL